MPPVPLQNPAFVIAVAQDEKGFKLLPLSMSLGIEAKTDPDVTLRLLSQSGFHILFCLSSQNTYCERIACACVLACSNLRPKPLPPNTQCGGFPLAAGVRATDLAP